MRSCFRCGTRSPSPKRNSPNTQLRRILAAKRVAKNWKRRTNKARSERKYDEALQAFRGFVIRSPHKVSPKLLAKLRSVSKENKAVVNKGIRSAQPRILKKIGNRVHPPPNGSGYNNNLSFNNRSNLVNAANRLNKVRFTPAQRKYMKRFMNQVVNNSRYFGNINRHATEPNIYIAGLESVRIRNGNIYDARTNNLWHRNVKVITRPYGRVGIKFVRQNYPVLLELKRKVHRW